MTNGVCQRIVSDCIAAANQVDSLIISAAEGVIKSVQSSADVNYFGIAQAGTTMTGLTDA
ncbi:MAG TPA: hypothetical protein VGC89_18935 [Pyrinomonadaceae bacterium]|jgi:hypothetical protein